MCITWFYFFVFLNKNTIKYAFKGKEKILEGDTPDQQQWDLDKMRFKGKENFPT